MPPGTMRRRRGLLPDVGAAPASGRDDMLRSYDITPTERGHRTSRVIVKTFVPLFVVLLGVFAVRASREWDHIRAVPIGPYRGSATLVGDPENRGTGVSVVFRIEGWRYEAVFYGADAWRVRNRMQGESVLLSATRVSWGERTPRHKLVRHVAGRLDDVTLGGDWTQGSALTRATNRLRRLIAEGASALPPAEGSLLVGLVIGDDRAQPRGMRAAFREAGLSHLTAVSGQNIAFVLAVTAPLVTRLRPRARLAATIGVLAAFTLMTRAEPSVLRASAMAGLAAVVFAVGGRVGAGTTLAVSASVLLVADPFLAWSVGFWLSVSATAGIVLLAPLIETFLDSRRVPKIVVAPLAASASAQIATMPVIMFVFGMPSLWGLPANMLAVPVAGAVMLCGLPICIVAGLLGGTVASLITLPLLLGVRYVWWVATLCGALPG